MLIGFQDERSAVSTCGREIVSLIAQGVEHPDRNGDIARQRDIEAAEWITRGRKSAVGVKDVKRVLCVGGVTLIPVHCIWNGDVQVAVCSNFVRGDVPVCPLRCNAV